MRSRAAVCLLAALAAAALLHPAGVHSGLATLAPVLLLLWFLLRGRYPGERLLATLASRRRFRPSRYCGRCGNAVIAGPSGARLIAFSLGGRAPPTLVVR